MVLETLRSFSHLRLIKLRAIHRLIETKIFENAYASATDIDKDSVKIMIDNNDKDSIVKWIKEQLYKTRQLGELPVTELRELCVNLGVRGYRYMTKASLLSAITNELGNDKNLIN